MGITVAQALKIGCLNRGRLLAGAQNLDNVVEYVNVIEALSEDDWEVGWEAKNHLLLTTFNAAKDDVQKQTQIIEIFFKNGCAGLIFQQGILSHLSPVVIQRAEELGLPLIEVPETVTYPTIITPLVGAILREKTFLLQRSQEIHRRLTGLILDGRGLGAIASALSELIDLPVVITDPWGNRLASANFDDIDEMTASILALTSETCGEWQAEPLWVDARHAWVSPILSGSQDIADGFIVVSDPACQLDQFDLIAVEQAATIAALDLARQKAVLEAERRLKRDFIEDMLGGGFHSVEAILARARSLGWDLLHKRVVAIIDLNSFEQYYLAHIERGEAYFQQIKERFLHTVTQAALERNPLSILVDRSDSIVLLPHFLEETPPSQARREVQALAEAICEQAQEQLDGLSISIAIGGFYGTVEGLRHSYNEARAALRVGSQMVRRRPIIWYDDVALYVFLDRFAAQPEVRRWYEQTIGPLLEYDQSHGTELVKTLETYFDTNQTLQQTARQLFIHPKTLKYRLRRIEEILGTDPFLGDKQLNFYLATKIASLL
jgi:purine catabolism regulator